jgi:hypothetical protein
MHKELFFDLIRIHPSSSSKKCEESEKLVLKKTACTSFKNSVANMLTEMETETEKFSLIHLMKIFHLLLHFSLLFVISCSRKLSSKIGFVFILSNQREYGQLQQISIWNDYFLSSSNPYHEHYVVAVINWEFQKPLPSFVNVFLGHETDYGGIHYIETILSTSQHLIDKHNVSAVIVLSGSCLPLRSFKSFYEYVAPIVEKGKSLLPERESKSPNHHKRYRMINITHPSSTGSSGSSSSSSLSLPKLSQKEFLVHQAQGYCLSSQLLSLLLRNWKFFRLSLSSVPYVDEHYVSYILRSLSKLSITSSISSSSNGSSSSSLSTLSSDHQADSAGLSPITSTLSSVLQEDKREAQRQLKDKLIRGKSLMYDDWSQKIAGHSSPKIWKTSLSFEEIQKYRKEGYYFIRKVIASCQVDKDILTDELQNGSKVRG